MREDSAKTRVREEPGWFPRHIVSIAVGVTTAVISAVILALIMPHLGSQKPKIEYWVKDVAEFDNQSQPAVSVYKIEFFNRGSKEEESFEATVDFHEGKIARIKSWPDGLLPTITNEHSVTFKVNPFNDGDHFTSLILYTGQFKAYKPDIFVSGKGPRAVEIDPEAEARLRWIQWSAFARGIGFVIVWIGVFWAIGRISVAYLQKRRERE